MGNDQVKGNGRNDCDLAGEWIPTRANEWTNRNIGVKHSVRATFPNTKMTYQRNGTGKGWVGDLYVKVSVNKLAPGHYNGKARVPALFWSANDGNFTILSNGTLEVRYPSNGIKEYWKRKNGRQQEDRGKHLLQKALSEEQRMEKQKKKNANSYKKQRQIMILFRRVDNFGITWHWALGIGNISAPSIYEVGGMMAIIGPKGTVSGKRIFSKVARSGTRRNQFKGYVILNDRNSTKTDEEIEVFSKEWCRTHPVYNPLGPNCQTFVEDLHIFLTGRNLEFSKIGDLKSGPEASSKAVWL